MMLILFIADLVHFGYYFYHEIHNKYETLFIYLFQDLQQKHTKKIKLSFKFNTSHACLQKAI